MPFSIIALQSGVTRISLEGDLAVAGVQGLRPELQAVARRCPRQVEMQLAHLRSITPAGLSLLQSFVRSLARIRCRVSVQGLRDQTLDAFKIALAVALVKPALPVSEGPPHSPA